MHQVPRKAWGTYSKGCVFCWKQFSVWKIPGEHGAWHHIRHKAIFRAQCGLCEPLPLHAPFAPFRERSYLLQYAGRTRTDLTSGTQQLNSASATTQPCPVQDNSLHFFRLTGLWSSWPWSEIEARDTDKNCSRKPWTCHSTRTRLMGRPPRPRAWARCPVPSTSDVAFQPLLSALAAAGRGEPSASEQIIHRGRIRHLLCYFLFLRIYLLRRALPLFNFPYAVFSLCKKSKSKCSII